MLNIICKENAYRCPLNNVMFNGFYFLIIKMINNGNLGGGRHPEISALYIYNASGHL